MGRVGGSHQDEHDYAASLSCLLGIDTHPAQYRPSIFILVELGMFIEMTQYSLAYFSGLRTHFGLATRSDSEVVVPWAIRLGIIWYPQAVALENTSSTVLAGDRVYTSRERPVMTNGPERKNKCVFFLFCYKSARYI